MDKKRTLVEKEFGIKGVYNDLGYFSSISKFKEGDIILISLYCNQQIRNYPFPLSMNSLTEITKSCTIINANYPNGQNYVVLGGKKMKKNWNHINKYSRNVDDYGTTFLSIGSKDGSKQCCVQLVGLHFDMDYKACSIHVHRGSSLKMVNCIINADNAGIEFEGDELYVDDCNIEVSGVGIRIGYQTEKVIIENSTFLCPHYGHCYIGLHSAAVRDNICFPILNHLIMVW